MGVGRVLGAVVAWSVAAVLAAVPVTAADDRPTIEVTPTRALHLATLESGDTRWGEIEVRNHARSARVVRLTLEDVELPRLPGRVVATVALDDIVMWSGPVRQLRTSPVLPGRLEAGDTWELDVRVTSVPVAGDVEVLGEQATRGGGGGPLDAAAPPTAGVSLSADALDPRGHAVPLRVQLVSYLLLVAGLLWLVVAFRRSERRVR